MAASELWILENVEGSGTFLTFHAHDKRESRVVEKEKVFTGRDVNAKQYAQT